MKLRQLGDHPLKTSILFSLGILTFGEFFDGHWDISDIVSPILLIIFFINFFILHSHEELYNFHKPIESQSKKAFFSLVVLTLFMSSIMMDALQLSITFKLSMAKLGFTLWAAVFMANSILEHRKKKKIATLLFSQVAFLTLVFSIMHL